MDYGSYVTDVAGVLVKNGRIKIHRGVGSIDPCRAGSSQCDVAAAGQRACELSVNNHASQNT